MAEYKLKWSKDIEGADIKCEIFEKQCDIEVFMHFLPDFFDYFIFNLREFSPHILFFLLGLFAF